MNRFRLVCLSALLLCSTAAIAAGPDLRIGDLYDTDRWGQVGDIVAYSIGTDVCNFGDENADWQANNNRHPVIAQNMYRHKGGRIEQIGMGWLKHGFAVINGDSCNLGCQFGGGGLGVGCSDPYSAGLNGSQGNLGPRFEVNAATGVFEWPFFLDGQTGNNIFKRIQVHEDDLIAALNPGATYFIEGQYVTQDEAQAGNGADSVSYREVRVESDLDLRFEAPTVMGVGAIHAWKELNPDVQIFDVDVADDGRLTVASRAIDLGDGTWGYEYAMHNINSHRSAQSFAVPLPSGASVSDVGFHDVDYHSGEPYDLTDWASSVGANAVSWSTDDFNSNQAANALRWGTMYNYRFRADAPPRYVTADLGLFRPGTPSAATAIALGPEANSGPGLSLAQGGCPGPASAALDGLTANGDVAVVSGTARGTMPIPAGPCAGTPLGIVGAQLVATVTADGDGRFIAHPNLGNGLCGLFLQTVDLTTCELSNVVELP